MLPDDLYRRELDVCERRMHIESEIEGKQLSMSHINLTESGADARKEEESEKQVEVEEAFYVLSGIKSQGTEESFYACIFRAFGSSVCINCAIIDALLNAMIRFRDLRAQLVLCHHSQLVRVHHMTRLVFAIISDHLRISREKEVSRYANDLLIQLFRMPHELISVCLI